MKLLELAERCEAASGPDVVLAQDIADYAESIGLLSIGMRIPDYTASLDAAMTLVPEGFVVKLEAWPAHGDTPAKASIELWGTSEKRWGRDLIWGHGSEDVTAKADASTPALALCAAALRARAKQEGEGE